MEDSIKHDKTLEMTKRRQHREEMLKKKVAVTPTFLLFFFYTFFLSFYSQTVYSKQFSTGVVIDAPEILQEAKKIPHDGEVKVTSNDYVYLKVSDDYVKKLYPLLLAKLTAEEKKCLRADKSKIGAHVTLFSEEEHVKIENFSKKQLNYSFQISELVKVDNKKRLENSFNVYIGYTWYILRINSQGLQKFLVSIDPTYYTKFNRVKPHISIGVSKRVIGNGQCYNH